MNGSYEFLITIGCLMLLGLGTDLLGKKTSLPRVSLLIVFGAVIGPSMLDLIPDFFLDYFELVAQMALVMVGFILGSKFTPKSFVRKWPGNHFCFSDWCHRHRPCRVMWPVTV